MKYLTHADIKNACVINPQTESRLKTVHNELQEGLAMIECNPKSVTIFGSARFGEDHIYYKQARELARKIVSETDYAITTGGGPGIMEAANRGAVEGNGTSIGFSIKLPREQFTNEYVRQEVSFHYFFTRKVCMTYSAEAYIYFPGGFGTLDELFEVLTLIQTEKIPRAPIFLVGKDYWEHMDHFIRKYLLDELNAINREDLSLYTITDDTDFIISEIKRAPVRRWN